jgi:hypothetical protein
MITSLQRMVFNLLEPVGLVWAALGLFTLWALSRKRWRLALLPGLLALLMFVIGSTGFSGWLLGRLEKQHLAPPLPELPVADAVVVLGGGFEPSRLDAFGLGVTADGDRLFMGLELMRPGVGGSGSRVARRPKARGGRHGAKMAGSLATASGASHQSGRM